MWQLVNLVMTVLVAAATLIGLLWIQALVTS